MNKYKVQAFTNYVTAAMAAGVNEYLNSPEGDELTNDEMSAGLKLVAKSIIENSKIRIEAEV